MHLSVHHILPASLPLLTTAIHLLLPQAQRKELGVYSLFRLASIFCHHGLFTLRLFVDGTCLNGALDNEHPESYLRIACTTAHQYSEIL